MLKFYNGHIILYYQRFDTQQLRYENYLRICQNTSLSKQVNNNNNNYKLERKNKQIFTKKQFFKYTRNIKVHACQKNY